MRMVILHSGFLMVKSFKWLTLFIFPLFQIFALAQEEREGDKDGGKGNSFTFGVGRRVCVGQPLARWKISCCWNFCIFSHQDGDASSSFDSDPTVCPVCARRGCKLSSGQLSGNALLVQPEQYRLVLSRRTEVLEDSGHLCSPESAELYPELTQMTASSICRKTSKNEKGI